MTVDLQAVAQAIALYDEYARCEAVAAVDEAAYERLPALDAEWDGLMLTLYDAGVRRDDLAAALSAAGRPEIAENLGDELLD
jgi:hypothetical protein